MSTDMPGPPVDQPAEAVAESVSKTAQWAETALTVLFATSAVLFVSFLAAVTGLV